MGYGVKLENLQTNNTAQPVTGSTDSRKAIFNALKRNGISVANNSETTATEVLLQERSISVSKENKSFSLIPEQTKENKIDNPNVEGTKKKRQKTLSSVSFPSNEDPFYETGLSKPQNEDIEKANKDREMMFKKSMPIASYLATNNGNK